MTGRPTVVQRWNSYNTRTPAARRVSRVSLVAGLLVGATIVGAAAAGLGWAAMTLAGWMIG